MTLAYLWKRLEAMGADVEQVKSDIISVILKSLMCGEDHIPFQVRIRCRSLCLIMKRG